MPFIYSQTSWILRSFSIDLLSIGFFSHSVFLSIGFSIGIEDRFTEDRLRSWWLVLVLPYFLQQYKNLKTHFFDFYNLISDTWHYWIHFLGEKVRVISTSIFITPRSISLCSCSKLENFCFQSLVFKIFWIFKGL